MRGEGLASKEVDSTICFSPQCRLNVRDQSFDRMTLCGVNLWTEEYTVAKKKVAKKAVKKVAKKPAMKKGCKC